MNYIDKNMEWLSKEIKAKTEEELFLHMKNKYLSLPKEIKKSLEKFLSDFPYWGKLDSKKEEYEEIYNKAISFHHHIDDYIWLYEKLEDYRSKKLLFAILYNWYDYNMEILKGLNEQAFCHYFDMDLVKAKDEVFVDMGTYIGDSVLDFINSYGTDAYKKIYCYEITKDILPMLNKNIQDYSNIIVKNKAVGNKNAKFYVDENKISASANVISKEGKDQVEMVTLDDDIKEKVTMIKMDIEGSEQDALLGCKTHIQTDHPTLLISVYHNHEDLWKIPRMIDEWEKGYQFYLRFYGNNLFPTEIVLIAIYKE